MASDSAFADLQGKVALVLGGAGLVGGTIALHLLAKGATVAVASRSQESLDKLQKWTEEELAETPSKGKLLTFKADVSTEAGAQSFAETLKSATGGQLDHVVASLGAFAIDGPILEVSLDRYHQQFANYVTTHFIALKTFLPLIADKEGTSYTIVTGGAGSKLLMPGSGIITFTSSALFGLSTVVRTEYQERAARVNELRVSVFVKRQNGDENLKPWEASYKKIGAIGAGLAAHKTVRSEVINVSPDTINDVLRTYVQ